MKGLIGFLFVVAMTALTGCDAPNPNGGKQAGTMGSSDTTSTAPQDSKAGESDTLVVPTLGADGLIHIDIDKLKTGVSPADIATYSYPFAIDSEPVKNYAKEYKITPQQAQRAMTLSMASPEALNKVLDQIVGEYMGHSLSDGANMSLVVFTSDRVAETAFDYVIADKFGEGLVLPVKLIQASKSKDKPQVDVKSASQKLQADND